MRARLEELHVVHPDQMVLCAEGEVRALEHQLGYFARCSLRNPDGQIA